MPVLLSKRLSEKAYAGIMGFIVGDALGVPYEFRSRRTMAVLDDIRMTGYGTHKQPPGTWSDDTSMMLCVLENCHLNGTKEDLARLFLRWYKDGYLTPHGEVFDIGITTQKALNRLIAGHPIPSSDREDESSVGNGSLMRSLPYAFFEDFTMGVARMLEDNRITHPATLCHDCCRFYVSMARALSEGASKEEAFRLAGEHLLGTWDVAHVYESRSNRHLLFARLLDPGFVGLSEDGIQSSGYVIESLEAAVWCFLQGETFRDSIGKAVRLGEDTDTVAALTGGLAGIHKGLKDIPPEWMDSLVKRERLTTLVSEWLELPSASRESNHHPGL